MQKTPKAVLTLVSFFLPTKERFLMACVNHWFYSFVQSETSWSEIDVSDVILQHGLI